MGPRNTKHEKVQNNFLKPTDSKSKNDRKVNKLQSDVMKPISSLNLNDKKLKSNDVSPPIDEFNKNKTLKTIKSEKKEEERRAVNTKSYSSNDFPNILTNKFGNTEGKYESNKINQEKNSKPIQSDEKLFFQSIVQDLNQFNLIKVIGRGTFGKVILVNLKTDKSQIFALKIIKKQHIVQTKNVSNIINEKKLCQNIDSPFIVKLRCSFQNKEKIFMAFDYHNGGELFFHLQRRKRLPENEVRLYAAELYLALKYLHNKGIIYRDIKPENIILDKDGHIKLIDFGLAKKLNNLSTFTKSFCGTNEYIRKLFLYNYI